MVHGPWSIVHGPWHVLVKRVTNATGYGLWTMDYGLQPAFGI
jgi:hypothetical protein